MNVWLPLERPLLGTWPTAQARALSGNRTGDPLVGRLALSPLSHTSQGSSSVFFSIHILSLIMFGEARWGRHRSLDVHPPLPQGCSQG